jgi:hypothetical protein
MQFLQSSYVTFITVVIILQIVPVPHSRPCLTLAIVSLSVSSQLRSQLTDIIPRHRLTSGTVSLSALLFLTSNFAIVPHAPNRVTKYCISNGITHARDPKSVSNVCLLAYSPWPGLLMSYLHLTMWLTLSVHPSPNAPRALVAEIKPVSHRNLIMFHFARSSLSIGVW